MRGSFSTHIARTVGGWVYSRPAAITWKGGVVSFTFDDFPKTALSVGGSILERYGRSGTYYVALGLCGQCGEMGALHDADDIRSAHARGHEIACHTYSHLDCSRAAKGTILTDITANAVMTTTLIEGAQLVNFAYPFGALSLGAKRVVGAHYASCRGTGGGINRNRVDLAHLLSQRIYASDFDAIELKRLIDENGAVDGWLIFYTHDVTEQPSPYGCTPYQLETVVAYAAERCTVLPVRDVVTRLVPRSASPAGMLALAS
jgi:peptidoglycan/xylan/chitin deacetylase (PgdA/CDA1 family)